MVQTLHVFATNVEGAGVGVLDVYFYAGQNASVRRALPCILLEYINIII